MHHTSLARKWLAGAALLALCSLLFLGFGRAPRAAAQTYSFARLQALLVNADDISSTGLQYLDDQTQTLDGGLLQVIRTFGATVPGGAAVGAVSLVASPDGSSPPSSVTNQVADGTLLRAMAQGTGAVISDFTLTGSQGVGDLDQSVSFNGILNGSTYRFYGDAFVSGNLVAMVLYGAPVDVASADDALTMLYAQDNKLP